MVMLAGTNRRMNVGVASLLAAAAGLAFAISASAQNEAAHPAVEVTPAHATPAVEITPASELAPASAPAPSAAPASELIPTAPATNTPVVQIAILLDTSGSMDGLIEQAKTQLWAIVNQFATAKVEGVKPRLEVSLYQYGNDGLEEQGGYVQQILGLTDDLDAISQKLFALQTNGGSEYCGTAIKHAASQLTWSSNPRDLKMIVIAGNEPFTQGSVNYQESVPGAVKKGIIVNTIFCGGREEGVGSNWEDGAKLGEGAFSVIDQGAPIPGIEAPQDPELARLSSLINSTYLAFGEQAEVRLEMQTANDAAAAGAAPAVAAERAATKASGLYRNSMWDLVDATRDGTVKLEDMKDEELPEEMRKMTKEERVTFVKAKQEERTKIQSDIAKLAQERDAFIAQKRTEMSQQEAPTFGEALLKAIREQGTKKGYEFKK
jgi:hypothetical protein